MKIEEISQVKICHSEKDVNEALKKGYIIKKIISSKTTYNGEGEEILPCFVLGLRKK